MNMFKPVKAASITEYMATLPEERKVVIEYLHKLIQQECPTLKPLFAYNMLGYGTFKYKNYKKEIIDWPTLALANQKNYISLYVCAVDGKEYLAEKYKDQLGKVSVGKSCIRFKKIEDVNIKTLIKIIKMAEKSPGLFIK